VASEKTAGLRGCLIDGMSKFLFYFRSSGEPEKYTQKQQVVRRVLPG
jgi:hypothetical protein